MSLHGRIKEARKNKGITQAELGALIGVAKTTIAGYEKNSEPTAAQLGEIADVLDVDITFLLQDEIKRRHDLQATIHEMEHLIKKYRLLDHEWQEAVDSVLDIGYRQYEKRLEEKRDAAILREQREQAEAAGEIVPDVSEMLIYVNPAAAGMPLYAESDFERIEFPSSEVPRGTDFGIRISGRSMEPTFMDGSIVWVRKRLDIPNGTVGIFMLNDSAVCKRFFKEPDGTVRLESDNPEFPGVPITEFDTFVVVGEVVGTV